MIKKQFYVPSAVFLQLISHPGSDTFLDIAALWTILIFLFL